MECEADSNCEKNITVIPDNKELSKPTVSEDEEILGSMTTYNSAEGSDAKTQQVRSSARVYKKMKLDTTPSVSVEKPDQKEEEVKLEHKRSFRMLWGSHDKDLFFEALNEYGKDFESICSFICSKSKKKGLPDNVMKTRDQIRHMYYRTWNKISKYLQFSEGIKKVAQELYGLINFGEMRRKIRFVINERYMSKLQDLIYRGAIAIRDKGKTTRLKTPMCRALRRLNQLDERYDELKLPARIVLELKPKNMHAYLKVQSMAQNPRLRTVVPLHKRLGSVILSISKRWKTIEAHIYDKAIVSKSLITNDCIPSETESDRHKIFLSPLLRFTPPEDVGIEIPSINLSEYFTRQCICLRAYENKLGIKNSENQLLEQNESNLKILNKGLPKKVIPKEHESTQELEAVREVVSSMIQLQNTVEGATLELDKKTDTTPLSPSKIIMEDDLLEKRASDKIEEIRKGWTLSNCSSVSIGDLYLMFGKHSKLVLEYSWDAPQRKFDNCVDSEVHSNPTCIADEELSSHSDKNPTNIDTVPLENDWECNISSSLRKLISIAKIHYRKNNKCVCSSTSGIKGNISAKSKSTTRTKSQPYDSNEPNESFNDDGLLDENAVDGEPSINLPDSTISNLQPSGFRRPNVPTVPMVHLITQLDSIQKLKPRYRKSRRPRFNQMVVERQLSLLPNNTAGGQIVRMNIIPQTNKIEPTVEETGTSQFSERMAANSSGPVFKEESFFQLHNITDIPPDIQENANCEGFDTSDIGGISAATPSTSPSRILKENDNQWLSAEVADFSLSSFLGRLDSPSKTLLSVPVCNEDCVITDETMS